MRHVATSIFGRVFAAFIFVGMLGATSASAASPAETYIQDNVQKGLSILNDKSLSREAMRTQFQSFLEGLTDVRRIPIFTLGPAAKTAAPADVDAFVEAFRGYAAAVYEEQLSRYSGQSLKVASSIQHAPGDFVVQTYVVDPNGSQSANSDEVDFRVLDTGGKMVVIDASVMGAWLAVQERDQFTAFLASHGNDIKALTADVERRAANVRNGTN